MEGLFKIFFLHYEKWVWYDWIISSVKKLLNHSFLDYSCVLVCSGGVLSYFFVQDCPHYLGVFHHCICSLHFWLWSQSCLPIKVKLLKSLHLQYFKDVEVIFGSLQDLAKILERHRWIKSSSGIHFSALFFSEFLTDMSFWLMDLKFSVPNWINLHLFSTRRCC